MDKCTGCKYVAPDSAWAQEWYVCDHRDFRLEYPNGRPIKANLNVPKWCPLHRRLLEEDYILIDADLRKKYIRLMNDERLPTANVGEFRVLFMDIPILLKALRKVYEDWKKHESYK